MKYRVLFCHFVDHFVNYSFLSFCLFFLIIIYSLFIICYLLLLPSFLSITRYCVLCFHASNRNRFRILLVCPEIFITL